jgi:hypothetical protein
MVKENWHWTHPIEGWFAPDEQANGADYESSEDDNDEDMPEDDNSGSDCSSDTPDTSQTGGSSHSSMPDLQMVSNSSLDSELSSSEPSSDSEDEEPPNELTSIEDLENLSPGNCVQSHEEFLTNPLSSVAKWVLAQGAPYPGDPPAEHIPATE